MTIEDIERFWSAQPCNIHHSPVSVDERPYLFSKQVTTRKYSIEPHIPRFAQFPRWDGCSVLDLGCGIGTDTLTFAVHGARVWALDISGKSLEIARKRMVALGLQDSITFIQGNIENLFLKPELLGCRFDLVYSFGVLHHTPCPERALRCARHYMHKDSMLKIMLYHRYTPKVLSALVRHWRPGMTVDDAVAQMSEAQAGSPLTRTYTKASARKLLKGFEILDMHVDHIFPWRIEDYVGHEYMVNWWWRWMPKRLFRWLERRFGWHLLITARLEEK